MYKNKGFIGLGDHKLNRTWLWGSITYIKDLSCLLTSSAFPVSKWLHTWVLHASQVPFSRTTASDAIIGLVHALGRVRDFTACDQ